MPGFLVFVALSLVAVAAAGVFALPFILFGALIWLVLLPIRLLFRLVFGVLRFVFRLVFGILGAVLGLIVAPIVMVVVAVGLVVAFAAAVIALLAPFIPIVLLGMAGWVVYRFAIRPKSTALVPPIPRLPAPPRPGADRWT